MAKINLNLADQEFDAQIEALRQKEQGERSFKPACTSVHYDAEAHLICLELNNGISLKISPNYLQEICELTPEELAQVKLGAFGASIRWPQKYTGIDIENILLGRFGTRQWMEKMHHKYQIPLGFWDDISSLDSSSRENAIGKTDVIMDSLNAKTNEFSVANKKNPIDIFYFSGGYLKSSQEHLGYQSMVKEEKT